jgi:uncharacterized protein (DUF427 family)
VGVAVLPAVSDPGARCRPAYWSVQGADELRADLAWSYDFPTRQLLPIAGLVAFYDEQVDVFLDGVAQPRPTTHFFS